ncbi:MAG: hypothetical protein H5U27_06050 [Methyloversatilis sp.]|nr:hypothetical protein [Methyloversatilis sp.]
MRNRCESAICESHSEATIDAIWHLIGDGQRYATHGAPDIDFEILHETDRPFVRIVPHDIRIARAAFVVALQFLIENGHDRLSPCEVVSDDDLRRTGLLCRATRDANGGVRCIDYILPILAQQRIVAIEVTACRTAWLTHAFLHTRSGRLC